MRGEVNDFVIETEGHCFFCDNKIPQVKWEAPAPIYSLQYLSRYLKLDMGKVFHEEGPVPPHLLAMVQGARLKGELCQDCAHFTEAFSKLYRNLEKIGMEMESVLSIIKGKLEKVTMTREDNKTELNGKKKIVLVLRNETTQKCSDKLTESSIGRVRLSNLTNKQMNAEMLKIRNGSDLLRMSNRRELEPPVSEPLEDDAEVKLESLNSDRITDEENEDNHSLLGTHDRIDLNDNNGQGDEKSEQEQRPSKRKKKAPMQIESKFEAHCRIIPETDKYECTICSNEFATLYGFQLHYESSHLQIKYKCNLCGKEYRFITDYNRHHRAVHLGITVKCDICNETFNRRDGLLMHYRKRHPGASVPLLRSNSKNVERRCHLCGKVFLTPRDMQRHLESIHLKLGHECNICGKKLGRKDSLLQHMRTIHKNQN